jgi:glycosyltransferase involved in cell wall biosynthesis
MRILAIIKYPPIEGGVSAQSYWLCHALATAGHSVRVITNAAEVEATYKIHMRPLDMQRLTRTMESGGSVEVRWTSPWARTRWHFTPENNPSVSRLATVALDNALQWCPDLIYAWYLEPYGVAASLVSLLTGLPVVVQHAGSDRYNLTRNEELGGLYRTLLRQANTVAKSGGNYAGLGIVGHQSRRLSSKYFLPSEFAPDGPTLDLGELLQEVADRGDRTENDLDTSPLDPDRAIVGCYGKVGRAKGTFELLEAYASSCRLRESSQLVMMSGGLFLPAVRKRIVQLGLEENVRLVPFLPHWRVPEFIRLCSVVAFLERDFPIVQHGPTVAGEVRRGDLRQAEEAPSR